MTTTPENPTGSDDALQDQDLETVGGGGTEPLTGGGGDADGTDGTDGGDADGTDAS